MTNKTICSKCKDSGRPGYVVLGKYYDRMVPTDIVGEYKLTSGTEYAYCFWCHGTGYEEHDD